ncbi:MAG: hypothetical protein A2312_01625 [Candidatus Staskawiczbacteria bacterium RIFOXYB2_FULL_32_9]|uniref:Polymerase beta nucleotidyltransferase domain-containing protein n=1 Tax=Candidatus Staskawiczbacteria bacterium RIFOXYD1_FULL_32_13 TaxID=1802234 RepID=A0A1G2JNX2_9BACT|nr:MAG: hypothetical protein UR22_C0010G0024 [Parcubacteria group bacterium GW2011_GWC2_32_10]OGZ79007.1 MAG: hypothetical protein A2360_03000 [Candidatus Staskawiczbacteria bacterium RIFOXYB1_FULL_32_11]OGZ80893.1 MAG: hypothetical protein A2256_03620 [Candidatus Staskawiczbacteria bacterium RIFOXYA2_FULL_32_7]OGZ82963.1 MAG: hypothetical protein A2312_01625 [Candidatus Staskawiczbacteria bacterium RIFOXYB2_FULL_32_9]OGZ88267.1 MAG: hypothetical protein A2463_01505 [Candidatus Staskawiczbacter
MIKENEIKKITDVIVEKYQPEKIYLFGSFAWGNPTKDSDFDLFVIKDTNRNPFDRVRDVYRIIFNIGGAVDVLVYTPDQLERRKKLNDPFVMKIINEGKLLYAK